MPTTLDQIIAVTRKRVEVAKHALPMRDLAATVEALPADAAPRGFRRTLLAAAERSGLAIIAELKKASPSRGVIRASFHVGSLATQLTKGGAAALSVLTEEEFFDGSLANLREASAATGLPCLRKDFIVDEYQLYEARANRADAVLLIVAALTGDELQALHSKARELGMDVLVEVHDEIELARAAAMGAEMIGVNSRDLKTLKVNMEAHVRLAPLMPKTALRVAESGIGSANDLHDRALQGYHAFLIGESLMMAGDPGSALAQLLNEAKSLMSRAIV